MDTQSRIATPSGERSVGELIRELTGESSRLVKQEIALARVEIKENMRAVGRDVGSLVVGGLVAAVGGLTLVAFLIALLGDLLGDRYWLSALIVGAVLAGVGAWLALRAAKELKTVSFAPQETLDTLRSTQEWASAEAADLKAAIAGGGATGAAHARGNGAGARVAAPPPRRVAPDTRRSSTTPAVREPGKKGGKATKGSGAGVPLWKAVIKEIQTDDITGQAAKMAYYAFMALPPAIMALFGLAGLFGTPEIARWVEDQALLAAPREVAESILIPFIEQVVLNKAPGAFSIGLLLALWGASALFVGLMDTLNVAYDVEETRSFVKKRAIAMGTMVASVLFFLLAAGVLLLGPKLIDLLGMGRAGEIFWTVVRWPIAFAFMVVAFWVGYYLLPNKDQKGCKKVLLKAAAGAAVLWVVATAAFRVYIANFSSYSETYGFLGAFIIFLLWLYVTSLVVLAGGELASEMERRS